MTTVVIPDDEKGDRLAGSSGVKVPVAGEKFLVRSVRGASNSAGRSEAVNQCSRETIPHRKRMMGISGVPSR